MFKLFLASIVAIALTGCTETETTLSDNYTRIESYTTYTEIIKDNQTVTTTTTSSSSSDTTQTVNDSTPTESTPTYALALLNGSTRSITAAEWAAGTLPNLTMYLYGGTDYVVNQSGVQPELDNFSTTQDGFITYSLIADDMTLDGANVSPDNVSDITLVYKTKLYTFVKESNNIVELDPIPLTLNVK